MHVNINHIEPIEAKGLIYKAWSSVAPKKVVKVYCEGIFDEGQGIT